MHGVSRPLTLPFVQLHAPAKDAWTNDRVAFRSELRLSRRDYGIAGTAFWNSEFDPGRFAVADSIDIELEISATIPNTARWTVPKTDSLVSAVEASSAARVIADYLAVKDSAARPDANAMFVTAAKLDQRGKRADAIQLYGWSANRFATSPMRPMVFALIGEAHLKEGRRTDAEQAFRRAIELDPWEPRAVEWLRWLERRR